MNILPKKRWHVRTKENIARVRQDEAKAAEEEKAKQDRIKLAEREARRELLLERSRKNISHTEFIPLNEKLTTSTEHINFFKEVEEGVAELKQTNKEHDKEQKDEREKYEKQIGYLTYLGQDTNEALGKKNWYDVAPDRSYSEKNEINVKSKIREDPLHLIKKYTLLGKNLDEQRKNRKLELYRSILPRDRASSNRKWNGITNSDKYKKRKHKSKHEKRKSKKKYANSESETSVSYETEQLKKKQQLEVLRMERLKREKEERRRTEELLAKLHGEKKKKVKETFIPKYNSQFNPEFAKQNYDKQII